MYLEDLGIQMLVATSPFTGALEAKSMCDVNGRRNERRWIAWIAKPALQEVLRSRQRFAALPINYDEVAVRLHRDEVDAAGEPFLVAPHDPLAAVSGETWRCGCVDHSSDTFVARTIRIADKNLGTLYTPANVWNTQWFERNDLYDSHGPAYIQKQRYRDILAFMRTSYALFSFARATAYLGMPRDSSVGMGYRRRPDATCLPL